MMLPTPQTIKHHMKGAYFLLPAVGRYFSFHLLVEVLDFPQMVHSFEADLDILWKLVVLFASFPIRRSVKMTGFLK